jgi:hypothetical protein
MAEEVKAASGSSNDAALLPIFCTKSAGMLRCNRLIANERFTSVYEATNYMTDMKYAVKVFL